MTDDELRRLAEAATPGPWNNVGGDGPPWAVFDSANEVVADCDPETALREMDQIIANAAYITAACNAVPSLLDRLRDAEAREARLREALVWYADMMCELSGSHECCGKLDSTDCAGCPAKRALAEPQP